MRSIALMPLLLVFCFFTSTAAGQIPWSETTAGMREQASKVYKQADTKLNAVFNRLLAKIDDEVQKEKLRSAQRAWLKYRDANAEFESFFYDGGTIQPQICTNSLTTMTKNRTKELQHILATEFDR
jgi:uncharacterized protein YecT (DUF1311 family)